MSTADVKLNQGAFPSFANWGMFVCVCDNKSGEAFVEGTECPRVFIADRQRGDASCRGRSVAPQHKPLSSSVCHFLRCHRCGIVSPSCLLLPHHAPSFQTPGSVSVCASGGSRRCRACAQAVLFFAFFSPADVGKAFRSLTPPPPPPAPFLRSP